MRTTLAGPTATPVRRRPALTAGVGILVVAALSGFVAAVGPTALLTGPGSGATVDDILGSPGLFQLAIAALALVALLDVVVAWGLFHVFAATDRSLSRIAAWSRVAYAAVFAVAIAQLVGVSDALGGSDQASEQVQALSGLSDFHSVWQAALAFFGLHLVLTGRLAYTSRVVPRPVAVLVVLAGLGYLVDSIATWLVPGYAVSVSVFTAYGELLLGIWLVVKGASRAGAADRTPAGESITPAREPSSV